MELKELLLKANACAKARAWQASLPLGTPEEAFALCPRTDWMVWIALECGETPNGLLRHAHDIVRRLPQMERSARLLDAAKEAMDNPATKRKALLEIIRGAGLRPYCASERAALAVLEGVTYQLGAYVSSALDDVAGPLGRTPADLLRECYPVERWLELVAAKADRLEVLHFAMAEWPEPVNDAGNITCVGYENLGPAQARCRIWAEYGFGETVRMRPVRTWVEYTFTPEKPLEHAGSPETENQKETT